MHVPFPASPKLFMRGAPTLRSPWPLFQYQRAIWLNLQSAYDPEVAEDTLAREITAMIRPMRSEEKFAPAK
jgi:hypothetical protein